MALVACATSALAECAWVLWEELVGSSGREWSIVATATAPTDCGRLADVAVADRGARWRSLSGPSSSPTAETSREVQVDGNQVSVISKAGVLHYRYLCLPDTIDPRGFKGR